MGVSTGELRTECKLKLDAWLRSAGHFRFINRGRKGLKRKERTQKDVGTTHIRIIKGQPDLEGALGVTGRAEVRDRSNRWASMKRQTRRILNLENWETGATEM